MAYTIRTFNLKGRIEIKLFNKGYLIVRASITLNLGLQTLMKLVKLGFINK